MKPQPILSKILQKVAIMDAEGNVLVLRRAENYLGSRAGKWDLPGGNLEISDLVLNQPNLASLVREINEETGLEILNIRPVFVDSLAKFNDDARILVYATGFQAKIEQTKPTVILSHEHSKYGWVSLENAKSLDFGDDGGFHKSILTDISSNTFPQHIGACVILLDESKEKVLLGKRKNSYKAGFYGLPGGRIELGEEAKTTAIREVKEETGIEVVSLEFVSTIRDFQKTYDFIHFVFVSSDWTGTPNTCEPDKCEGWEWYLVKALPPAILNGHRLAIESYLNNRPFTDSYSK